MDDYKPIITQEEWEQFVQEFELELELVKNDDDDDFFRRLKEGGNW